MFRDSLAIEKCRLESILWASLGAGRAISSMRAIAPARPGCVAAGPSGRLGIVCVRSATNRQRRQVATSIAVGQCVRNGCVTAAEPGRRKCRRHLDEHAEQQRRRRGAGVGSDNCGFRESMPRPDLALARKGSSTPGAVRRPQPASLEHHDDATGALVGVVQGRIIVRSRSSPFGIVGGRGWGARPHEEAERPCRRQLDSASTRTPRRVHGLFRADYTQRTHA